MFTYSDPNKSLLRKVRALATYRQLTHGLYRNAAKLPNSAFTLLEAFEGLPGETVQQATVTWLAFPRLSTSSPDQIDQDRFRQQEEYVEWRTEKRQGRVSRITFTTEFPEYWEAIAQTGMEALTQAIQFVKPGANPKIAELFGPGFNPDSASPEARGRQFRAFATRNPWNNGTKEILFLTQPANTASALLSLVDQCAIPKPDISPDSVCGSVGGFCVPGRNSDPSVCAAVQTLARNRNGLSLKDPVGIDILNLQGIWELNGRQIDINDPATNQGVWTVSPSKRRAVLKVSSRLKVGGASITSGAQVAKLLQVGATVIAAPEAALPEWSRMGQESSRQLDEITAAAAAGDIS